MADDTLNERADDFDTLEVQESDFEWLEYHGLHDMDVELDSMLGETTMTIKQILNLEKGHVIDLKKPAGESVEVYVNGRIVGKGEVMVYEKSLAIRINEVLDSNAALYYLAKEHL
jgi:flagellar motor switch protein FliN/FliY